MEYIPITIPAVDPSRRYDALACLRRTASRWRRFRSRLRLTGANEGIGNRVVAGGLAPRSRTDGRQLPCLGGCRPGLHDIENRASLIGDTPATIYPLDETLGEDIEVGHAGCQSLRPFGPVPSAGRSDLQAIAGKAMPEIPSLGCRSRERRRT